MSLKHVIGAVITIMAFYHLRRASAAPFYPGDSDIQDISQDSFVAAADPFDSSDESSEEVGGEEEGRTLHHIAHFLRKPAKLVSNIAHGIGDLFYKAPEYEAPYYVAAPPPSYVQQYSHY